MPANNGAVLNIAQIIKTVMTLAAEVEIGEMFINAREAVPQLMTLAEMGHLQPRTPMQVEIPLHIILSLIMCNHKEQNKWTFNSTC